MSKMHLVFKVREGNSGWCGTFTFSRTKRVPGAPRLGPPDSHVERTCSYSNGWFASSPAGGNEPEE